MGLHPVLGRLLNEGDDGPNAAGAAVLTHRFWTTGLHSDPTAAVWPLVASGREACSMYLSSAEGGFTCTFFLSLGAAATPVAAAQHRIMAIAIFFIAPNPPP